MIQITEGFVLNKIPYRESSYLVNLFTYSLGHIKIIARRVRGGKNSSHFNLFSLGEWHLTEGREFFFQKEHDLVKPYWIQGRAIWTAYYLNELLLRLVPLNQSDSDVFNAYKRVLIALELNQNIELNLRQFEYQLLQFLGVLPDFSVDERDEAISQGCMYYLTRDHGVMSYKEGIGTFEISGDLLIKIEQHAYLSSQEATHYKKLMRYLIDPLLGNRPLQSRLWIEKLYNVQKREG